MTIELQIALELSQEKIMLLLKLEARPKAVPFKRLTEQDAVNNDSIGVLYKKSNTLQRQQQCTTGKKKLLSNTSLADLEQILAFNLCILVYYERRISSFQSSSYLVHITLRKPLRQVKSCLGGNLGPIVEG
ncbi:hypothetical protein BT96DRAFT_1049709 [Gymnopus androsaceus JB14]|uniref:Uncharacterized protein n=1 Tax=Gymnopus androsaceus JB14 TaxID=1447944 RepID=A0A6A4I9Q6_9AGAR|nr:hypothetical protein BT96DRAFT_1049709 [Gymnopus androsaceus JB14]